MINAKVDVTNIMLETDRLILRPWKKEDLEDFYEYAKVDGVGQILSISINENYANQVGREIGYVLSKAYWGKGLMPEAVKRVIIYCFEEEHYDYLICSHPVLNYQSKRVIEKCGFRFIKEKARTAINGTEHISLYYVLDNLV